MRRFWSKRLVFVSYRRGVGSTFAHLLAAELRVRGFLVTLDVDSDEAGPFEQRLRRLIGEADAFVVVLSAGMFGDARDPDWVTWEVRRALERPELPIVPVMSGGRQLADVELPAEIAALASLQAVTVPEEYRAPAFDRLERMLRRAAPTPRTVGTAPLRGPTPGRKRRIARVVGAVAVLAGLVALGVRWWMPVKARRLPVVEAYRSMAWTVAKQYCERLPQGGRLPTRAEMRGCRVEPCLYWTAEKFDDRPGWYYVVDAKTSESTPSSADSLFRVRCVVE